MPAPSVNFSPATIARLRQNLIRWFDRQGRPLPWRQTRDPYRIWISEVMLQQTTVKAVIPYFERFLDRFPTLQDLADATEEEVLKRWEGLGYYSRGRNLHRTARMLCRDFDGRFPADVAALQKLPGIGRYTAGAIVSLAFDRPAPILEANTQRVYCRLLGFTENPYGTAGQKALWKFAQEIQPASGAAKLNQALMDLGSQLCTPANPKCPECPALGCCRAAALGKVEDIPPPKPRNEVTPVVEAAVVVKHRRKLLLLRRLPGERWAGLWDFPRFEVAGVPHREKLGPHELEKARSELKNRLREGLGLEVDVGDLLGEMRHSVTRYRIRLLCFSASCSARVPVPGRQFQWLNGKALADVPLSTTGRKLAERLLSSASEKSAF